MKNSKQTIDKLPSDEKLFQLLKADLSQRYPHRRKLKELYASRGYPEDISAKAPTLPEL